jgi:hypothetical protein
MDVRAVSLVFARFAGEQAARTLMNVIVVSAFEF